MTYWPTFQQPPWPHGNWMAPQGWQCPCCHKVYSPTTPMCFTCGGTGGYTTTTAGTGTQEK